MPNALSPEETALAEEELRFKAKIYSLDDFLNGLDAIKRKFNFEMERRINAFKFEFHRPRNFDTAFTESWKESQSVDAPAPDPAAPKPEEPAVSKPIKTKKKPAKRKKKPTRRKKA